MKDVFHTLNQLKAEGVLVEYAIAGAMAFLFYTEPARTYDLNVFVFLPPQTNPIFSMEPLYKVLLERGFGFEAEHVMIEGTPVQFLPAYNLLSEKAMEEAILHEYEGEFVRVIDPEYLIALVFQTGGRHRLLRAEILLAEGIVNEERLQTIMTTHNIVWKSGG